MGNSNKTNMADEAETKDIIRQIKIKAGICRRIRKEYTFYVNDAKALRETVEKLKEDNEELWQLYAEHEENAAVIADEEFVVPAKTLLVEVGAMEEVNSMDDDE